MFVMFFRSHTTGHIFACNMMLLYCLLLTGFALFVNAADSLDSYTPLSAAQKLYFDANGNIKDGNKYSSSCRTTWFGGFKSVNCGAGGSVSFNIEPKLSEEELIRLAEVYAADRYTKCSASIFGEGPWKYSAPGNCESGTRKVKPIYKQLDKGDYWIIVTNGIPDHVHGAGQDKFIPTKACEQYRALVVPKNASSVPYVGFYGRTLMGPAGIATSGAFIFNHKSAEAACDAAAVTEKGTFDPCDGHSSPTSQYHYHKMPYRSAECIPGGYERCKLMGFMMDGVPIYSPCTFSDGRSTKSCYKLKDVLLADTANKYGCDTGDYEYRAGYNGCNLDDANGVFFQQAVTGENGVYFAANSYAYFYSDSYPYLPVKLYGGSFWNTYWCQISA